MSEHDLGIKLRVERALWSAGFYTRTNVRLAWAVPSGRRSVKSGDLTDVDVLGIRFLEDLEQRRVAVDCKSGRNVSAIGRAFWLRGVMHHFGGHHGYVVLTRDFPGYQREAAASLGVTLLRENELTQLESRYPTPSSSLKIGDASTYDYTATAFGGLPKTLQRLVEFRDTTFWHNTPVRGIAQAISLTRAARDDIDENSRVHSALVLDVATLFALAIIEQAWRLIKLSPSDLLASIRAELFGGPEGISRRSQIVGKLQALVGSLTAQSQLPLPDEVFQLDPPFLPVVGDVIARVMARPLEAAEAPRYLKVRLVNGVLNDDWNIEEAIGQELYSPISDKIAGDLVLGLLKAADIPVSELRHLRVFGQSDSRLT